MSTLEIERTATDGLTGLMLTLAAQRALLTGMVPTCPVPRSCPPIGPACLMCLLGQAQATLLDASTRHGTPLETAALYRANNLAEAAGFEARLHDQPPVAHYAAAELLIKLGRQFLLRAAVQMPVGAALRQPATPVDVTTPTT